MQRVAVWLLPWGLVNIQESRESQPVGMTGAWSSAASDSLQVLALNPSCASNDLKVC